LLSQFPLYELLAFGIPGGPEWIIILVVALLLFGRRLPEVARSVGKSIVEFKRGINEVGQNIDEKSQNDEQPRIEQQPKSPDSQAADGGNATEESRTAQRDQTSVE